MLALVEAEIAWLAGLWEGEGSFFTVRGRQGRLHPKAKIVMTDRDVIERVARLLEMAVVSNHSPVRQRKNLKPVWGVHLRGRSAVELMRTIRPWMGARRGARIDELLALCEPSGSFCIGQPSNSKSGKLDGRRGKRSSSVTTT